MIGGFIGRPADAVRVARVSAHLDLLFVATSFWTFFYLGGLPSDYYQTWSWPVVLVAGELLPAVALFLAGPRMMRRFRTTPTRAAVWCAFWWTAPLLAYDFVLLKLHEGQDWGYLARYWYLTGFTLVPWLVFPALAWRERGRAARASEAPATPQ